MSQTEALLRSQRGTIENWIREVCDGHAITPRSEADEESDWRDWNAPCFLSMRPVRRGPPSSAYDPGRVWKRADSKTTSRWLEHFYEIYVRRLLDRVDDEAGRAHLRLAEQPVAPVSNPPSTAKQTSTDFSRREAILERIHTAPRGMTFRNDEAACALGIHVNTVRNWIDEGRLTRGAKRATVTVESIRGNLPNS